ncbi:ribosomal protein S18-alanine N-acetyltransferase [Comamonas granuli]|uniref:ribosomal protein S18-alanine N-acetyltransferase n=1 Tax=Comamonas granuli TaxID=290309 RepID=UPI0005AB3E7F|nr:ribosomal protein S18-alanine N-acetyltransferase [Comamonas granuli]
MTTEAAVPVRLAPLSLAQLDGVLAIEQQAHAHPWSRRHFTDALASGYRIDLLLGGDCILGYFVAMAGVDEAHLLNLTVAPAFQRQGWAQVLLDALALWARARGLQWLWLEVRVGNQRARQVYEANGFQAAGVRKGYYPVAAGGREDAIVMSRAL